MNSVKEIKNKINIVKNTKKITKAMEMVAVSKMRKIQEKMLSTRPYFENIIKVINHVSLANVEYKHPYLQDRKTKNIGIIVISTDRGLCSNLNSILFKKILINMQRYAEKNIKCKLVVFGSKGFQFFNKLQCNIISYMNQINNKINLSELLGNIHILLQEYKNNNIDKIFIAYNHFQNTMIQIPKLNILLPIINNNQNKNSIKWDYIYEPNAKMVLNTLLDRFIESQIYQSILENLVSEQAARMLSMKNATDNSNNFIKELQLNYNKARQSSITQELIEIISGSNKKNFN
ncbi:ATP synthase gamma chain [Buchnera aphidicola (Eriosoma lanigerum)]|uniref:F0F1 ATP synthase subunit gamma n=1 Tax=Buchnera aphidicola TaxID=9 RepID=UPI0034641718